VAPGAGEPYSAALVVEVPEAVGGPGRRLHGPVGRLRLSGGVGDACLQEAQDLRPPGLDGGGEPLQLGYFGAGAPAVEPEQLVGDVVPDAAALGQREELAEFLLPDPSTKDPELLTWGPGRSRTSVAA